MTDLERMREALKLGKSLTTTPEDSVTFTLAENERLAHLKEDAETQADYERDVLTLQDELARLREALKQIELIADSTVLWEIARDALKETT